MEPALRYEPSGEEIVRYMLDTRVDEETFIGLQPGKKSRTASPPENDAG